VANQAPLTIGYNEYDDEFLLAVAPVTGGVAWYASRDCVTWTQRSLVTGWTPLHVRSTLGAWIALTDIVANFTHHIMISLDSGITWRRVPATLVDPGYYMGLRLGVSPPGQCMAHNGSDLVASMQM